MRSSIIKNEEKVQFQLRELYEQFGYGRFKMSKFEEYDLYSRNKEFLVSDGVITFTDTNGKLMALKPDVTLSIVKNTADPDALHRVYYNENVYRVSDKTHSYKEIMQTGLECLGPVDEYNLCEVVLLAARSLAVISPDCVLNISHLGVVSTLLEQPVFKGIRKPLIAAIGEKNTHEIRRICQQKQVDAADVELLCFLARAYGPAQEIIPAAAAMTHLPGVQEALAMLQRVCQTVTAITQVSVQIDFSLTGNIHYYNGLVFRGYVKGIPTDVLRGGQYDNLMQRLGRKAGAIGFAVYLDSLERMDEGERFDADVLLTYENSPVQEVLAKACALRAEGKTVAVHRRAPEKGRYEQVICLDKGANGNG